ncbi:MAG: nicotinate-nucleotide diphosphorylase (carboxylating) [Acidimicrobiaceae bacterium]|nr:nicotinate-nucleotide diphosphorylase (carboxylating) [Acidimicrobiaceae bacterium]
MNETLSSLVERSGLDAQDLTRLVKIALDEDLRWGPDATTESTIDGDHSVQAEVVARQPGVVCGLGVALSVLDEVSFPLTGVTLTREDGEAVTAGDVVMRLSGPLPPLLLAERSLLNFLTHLSGIATATDRWVRAIEGTDCRVRDTRKTTPGLRSLEKYAVRCGGGLNHRMGLGDAALIKDNHIDAAGGITKAVTALRRSRPDLELEVECDTLDQVREAVRVGCSLILLDNMDLETLRAAVTITREAPGIRVEASGGITLERARDVADTGVDYIAVGSLTHSVRALDLGLDVVSTMVR